MKRINPVIFILVLSVVFIIAVELSSALRSYLFQLLSLFLALLASYAIVKKQKADTTLISFILLWFIGAKLLFSSVETIALMLRAAAILAFIILSLVVLIGPWSYFSKKVLSWYYYRRHLGVSALLVGFLHVALVMSTYYNYSVINALQDSFTVFGLSAFSIMMWLGLTSWDYLQKKVKPWIWTTLHALLFITYISVTMQWYTIQKNDTLASIYLLWIGFFCLCWIISSPLIIRYIMRTPVLGWKQVHVLVHIAYISLVLHVYFGVLFYRSIAARIAFLIIPAFVYLSHAAGWIKKMRTERKPMYHTLLDNQVMYQCVALLSELQEGKGIKVFVEKKTVALFLHKGEVIALSDVCAHQKGPLHRGRILGDYVECPWHQWTYNVKDGCGPPGFHDCVPHYLTKVKQNTVYVAITPTKKQSQPL